MKLPRCPFQNVNACPRYFYSLSLLGNHGCTRIAKAEDTRLTEYWNDHPLAPQTAEQDTGISSTDKGVSAYHNLCPEVAFDRFGYFASYLSTHADELDTGFAHEALAKESAPSNDPRWNWRSITPQHYAACPFYSQLSHDWPTLIQPARSGPNATAQAIAARFDVFISHASEDKSFARPLAKSSRPSGSGYGSTSRQ